jgi:hypothetical protein
VNLQITHATEDQVGLTSATSEQMGEWHGKRLNSMRPSTRGGRTDNSPTDFASLLIAQLTEVFPYASTPALLQGNCAIGSA